MTDHTIDLRRCYNHIYKNGVEQKSFCHICFGTGFEMQSVLAAVNLLDEIRGMIEKKRPGDPLKTRIEIALKNLNYK